MEKLNIYTCDICGNMILMLRDSGVVPECCGKKMTRIAANTEDADTEKHVPVIQRAGNTVKVFVGERPHPMTPDHHISRIYLLTDKGVYMRCLPLGTEPEAVFTVGSDEDIRLAYCWCNIHGLWKNLRKEKTEK